MHSFFTSMAIVLPNSQQHINVNLVQDYQNTLEIDDVITLKERVACAELITKYSYPQLSSVKESLIKDMSSIPSTFIKKRLKSICNYANYRKRQFKPISMRFDDHIRTRKVLANNQARGYKSYAYTR